MIVKEVFKTQNFDGEMFVGDRESSGWSNCNRGVKYISVEENIEATGKNLSYDKN